MTRLFQLCFYVPESHLEVVKRALFEQGAGRFGAYDACCWETAGTGQFRPLAGSDPCLGECGRIERVAEFKVEMVCQEAFLAATVARLLEVHPYELPAYRVYPIHTVDDLPPGRSPGGEPPPFSP